MSAHDSISHEDDDDYSSDDNNDSFGPFPDHENNGIEPFAHVAPDSENEAQRQSPEGQNKPWMVNHKKGNYRYKGKVTSLCEN